MVAMLPPDDICVLRPLLDRHAAAIPEKVFVRFASGEEWTYADMRDRARRFAAALRRLGLKREDRLLVWLPNGPEILRAWFGSNYFGATYVPINTAYRGGILQNVVTNSQAEVAIVHWDLAERLSEIELIRLKRVIVIGGVAELPAGVEAIPSSVLDDPAGEEDWPVVRPWNTQAVIYTSGTTGPSKGVLVSYLHLYTMSIRGRPHTADDRMLVSLPLFHSGGMGSVCGMLARGGSIGLSNAFKTSEFWNVVRETQSTFATLIEAMVTFLLKEPASAGDRTHRLRAAALVPLPPNAREFSERFGVDVYTNYNLTEGSNPIVAPRNPTVDGSCGKLRTGVTARVVDENDCEVPVGEPGELILRTELPWEMSHGYNGNPEATASLWRNGWLHTGDRFRQDEAGNFFFLGRNKDAIRRRGENISSFEVEQVILQHECVREVAVIGVPSAFGEEEVLAVVAPVAGKKVKPAELIEFVRPKMAHFMVPRYVRTIDALPRTETQKVQKYLLRADGLTGDIWDRDANRQ